MKKILRFIYALLPHILIILSCMLIMLCIFDRFNSAMNFVNNNITKTLIVSAGTVAVIVSCLLIAVQRKK